MVNFVVTTLDDNTTPDGQLTLREAISNINNPGVDSTGGDGPLGTGDDTITFAPGLSGGTITLSVLDQLIIANGARISIDGDTDGDGTADITISGDNDYRVFMVAAGGELVLENIDIVDAGDTGVFSGGAIENSGTTSLDNVSISGSVVSNEGGAIQNNGILEVHNSRFTDNEVTVSGGGAINQKLAGTSLTVSNSDFIGNSSDDGGAVSVLGGSLVLTNSVFENNEGRLRAGALWVNNQNTTSAEISNSTFVGNSTGGNGGAIELFGGTHTLANLTVAHNEATNNGGGIFVPFATVSVFNSTITGNKSTLNGGGIGELSASLDIINSIIAGNSGSPLSNNVPSAVFSGKNIVGDAGVDTANVNFETDLSVIFDQVAVNTLGINSGVVADNGGVVPTAMIKDDGVAHNSGDNSALPADSQDLDGDADTGEPLPVDARGPGFSRVADTTVDIGAFEIKASDMKLVGTNKKDNLVAESGNDKLIGKDGRDTLDGKAGNDLLRGGKGADCLIGGEDADTFDFNSAKEIGRKAGKRDVIKDFEQGLDIIDLSDIDAKTPDWADKIANVFGANIHKGNQKFNFVGKKNKFSGVEGELRYEHHGNKTIIKGDTDGDTIAEFKLELTGIYNLNEDDFIL